MKIKRENLTWRRDGDSEKDREPLPGLERTHKGHKQEREGKEQSHLAYLS